MANARHEARNANWLAGALNLTPQTACPIPSGGVGLWVNSTYDLLRRSSDGSDSPVANVKNVAIIQVDAVSETNLQIGGLDFVYDNGTSGYGATLTGGANGAFPTVDGVTAAANKIYLFTGLTISPSGSKNGAYILTTLGTAGTKAVLTRIQAFDVSADMKDGTLFVVKGGTSNADTTWKYTGGDSPTVGTTALTFERDPGVVTTNTAQTITGAKTFAVSTLKAANAAGTYSHIVASSAATSDKTVTLPNVSFTVAQAAAATASGTASITIGGNTASDGAAATSSDGAVATSSDGAVASSSETATMVAEARSGSIHYLNPAAQSANAGAAAIIVDVVAAAGAQIVAAQPDYARKLHLFITDADSSISAGTLDLVGVGASGEAVTESIALTGGTAAKASTKAYATLTSAAITGLVGADGVNDKIALGINAALALPGNKTPASSAFAVHKACVDAANETIGTVDATAGTIAPTTAADGTHDFTFYYTYAVTPTQNAHSHTGGAHTHTGGAHTHTGAAHTHGATGLTGTDAGHTHTQS